MALATLGQAVQLVACLLIQHLLRLTSLPVRFCLGVFCLFLYSVLCVTVFNLHLLCCSVSFFFSVWPRTWLAPVLFDPGTSGWGTVFA